MRKYMMKADSNIQPDAKKGSIVYEACVHDYGTSRGDSQFMGFQYVSVTFDENGGYPLFSVPLTSLQPID